MKQHSQIAIGVALALTGLWLAVSSSTKSVSAAGAGYTESWQATQYRTAVVYAASNQSLATGGYCLGPSAWSVSGTVDSTSFQETWTVPGSSWIDTFARSSDGGDKQTRYGFSSTCVDDESLDQTSGFNGRVTTIGVYGGLASSATAEWDDWITQQEMYGVRSMPSAWHIEGNTR